MCSKGSCDGSCIREGDTHDHQCAECNDGWLVVHLSWDQVFRDPLGSARMANDAAWGAVVKANPWDGK